MIAVVVVVVAFAIFFFAGKTGPLPSYGRITGRSRNTAEFEHPRDESNLL